ncbi:MAG TPA: peptidase E [Candidatus Paceibacterota bacterium]|nr:peptidase E [Candidatus Paceibacterota bacterium]
MKIVAIGGGEIGRPGTDIETLDIDAEVVALSGKKRPRLVFLPTASGDDPGYQRVVEQYYGGKLGCEVRTLLLIDATLPAHEIREILLSADIIYVGGGNTLTMLDVWRSLGVDKMLQEAAEKDIVLAGVSAGAICWFTHAFSDSAKMVDPTADYIVIDCLGFLPGLACPHFDDSTERAEALKLYLASGKSAIAIDNCAALEISGASLRVIRSKDGAGVYRCRWENGTYISEPLATDSVWHSIDSLQED